MNYKESLLFIAKCLTIPHNEKNFKAVSHDLQTRDIDWDELVKLSTSHYVFTTLYCRFLSSKLLSFLPEDLVAYMQHLTEINRDRNQQIIEQATEINTLLRQNNINPIFLKGTGNLMQGLYEDLGERMVGDIDFIIPPDEYDNTVKTLKDHGYKNFFDHHNIPGKHYPRVVKEGSIAAVEIHSEMLKHPFESAFNYETIKDHIITKNGVSFLSYEHQLCLSIIAKQINDDGQYYNTISLRNAYDVLCFSRKVSTLSSIRGLDQIFHPLNNFLALCNCVLSEEISYAKTAESEKYLSTFNQLLNDRKFRQKHHKKWKRKLYWKLRFKVLFMTLYRKDYRIWFLKTIVSRRWLKKRFKSAS